MGRFLVRKRLKLDFLGEGWQDCYIDVTPFGPAEFREILEQDTSNTDDPKAAAKSLDVSQERLSRAFIEGKGYTAEGVVDLKPEDLAVLPMTVSAKLRDIVMGEVDPNLDQPSAT